MAQIDDLKLLGLKDSTPAGLLSLLLSKAQQSILNYCGLDALPEALQNVQEDIAVIYYNRLGMEGEQSRSEGQVSRSVFSEDLPKNITDQLKRYRKAKVMGT